LFVKIVIGVRQKKLNKKRILSVLSFLLAEHGKVSVEWWITMKRITWWCSRAVSS